MLAPTDKKVARSLKLVRNFTERLRSMATDGEDSWLDKPGVQMFFQGSLGGIRIAGAEATLYNQCLDSLTELFALGPEDSTLSARNVESLLQETILRILRPNRDALEPRERFAARQQRELSRLRKALFAEPGLWRVFVAVAGLGPKGLPFSFGGVEFSKAGTHGTKPLVAMIRDRKIPPRTSAKKIAAEKAFRAEQRQQVAHLLGEEAMAAITVAAVDKTAALARGIERVRRTVDVINFFALFLQEGVPRRYRAYLPADGSRDHLAWFAHPTSGVAYHWGAKICDEPAVSGLDLSTERARRCGAVRADALLSKPQHTDLEQQVIKALSWAGRAAVEHRTEQSFLLNAIALEALLTKKTARAGVTDRFKLRAAHVLGTTPAGKRKVFDWMDRLYTIRSTIVHSGSADDLRDRDLELLAQLVRRGLSGFLTDQRFTSMQTTGDFDRWFESQLLA